MESPFTEFDQIIKALQAENTLLREFYDAWVFFHRTKIETTDQPSFDETRQKRAAQTLVDAAQKVQSHIHRVKAH